MRGSPGCGGCGWRSRRAGGRRRRSSRGAPRCRRSRGPRRSAAAARPARSSGSDADQRLERVVVVLGLGDDRGRLVGEHLAAAGAVVVERGRGGHAVQPGAQVVGVAQAGIGAQRAQQRVLQHVLAVGVAGHAAGVDEQLVAVGLHERPERGEGDGAHVPSTWQIARMCVTSGRALRSLVTNSIDNIEKGDRELLISGGDGAMSGHRDHRRGLLRDAHRRAPAAPRRARHADPADRAQRRRRPRRRLRHARRPPPAQRPGGAHERAAPTSPTTSPSGRTSRPTPTSRAASTGSTCARGSPRAAARSDARLERMTGDGRPRCARPAARSSSSLAGRPARRLRPRGARLGSLRRRAAVRAARRPARRPRRVAAAARWRRAGPPRRSSSAPA